MQKISFGNKEYLKASEIAKRFKYTQDYVGQLCRSKKVDARLVGRIWYVEPSSVTSYRKTKHKTQKAEAAKVKFNKKTPRVTTPKPVAPVVRSKTVKTTIGSDQNTFVVPVEYEADKASTIPVLSSTTPAQPVEATETKTKPVEVVERTPQPAKKLKIKVGGKKQTKFKTDKIPEISLSGKVKVGDISGDTELPPRPPKEEEKVEKQEEVAGTAFERRLAQKGGQTAESETTTKKEASAPEMSSINSESNPPVPAKASVRATAAFTPTTISTRPSPNSNRSLWFYIAVSLVASSLVAFLLLTLGHTSYVGDTRAQNTLQFDAGRLSEILSF